MGQTTGSAESASRHPVPPFELTDSGAMMGMQLAAVHRGAIAESRKLKPEILHYGVGGRPIEDEVEFELQLERHG